MSLTKSMKKASIGHTGWRDSLARAGLRPTRQREVVYGVLQEHRDHPCANEVYLRAKARLSSISLATVYNCLELFVSSGIVRQLHFQRQSARFCPNEDSQPHFAHFHCEVTDRVVDVMLPGKVVKTVLQSLPDDYEAEHLEISFTGRIRPKQKRAGPAGLSRNFKKILS